MLESAGLPLPGETILLTAAVYAATTGRLNIAVVIAAAAVGAILGGNLGYLLGKVGGRALALRYGRFIHFGQRQLHLGERFFARHGEKTVFLSRFIAVLRPLGAFLAGVSEMPYRRFTVFNTAGGVVWASLYGILAFALGREFERYHVLLTRFGLALGVLAVLAVAASLLLGRKRLERWAVGEEA
ncbi:MAG TPA: DedA family protein [Candidatus Dormibacteraeota bacterium]|jgi:membrane protein DedA with SNARE-associated domain